MDDGVRLFEVVVRDTGLRSFVPPCFCYSIIASNGTVLGSASDIEVPFGLDVSDLVENRKCINGRISHYDVGGGGQRGIRVIVEKVAEKNEIADPLGIFNKVHPNDSIVCCTRLFNAQWGGERWNYTGETFGHAKHPVVAPGNVGEIAGHQKAAEVVERKRSAQLLVDNGMSRDMLLLIVLHYSAP